MVYKHFNNMDVYFYASWSMVCLSFLKFSVQLNFYIYTMHAFVCLFLFCRSLGVFNSSSLKNDQLPGRRTSP